ncbi:HAD hydrolase family protein [Methanobrevibacter filiformis]|uniref:Haloacid dehalogenase-like hydrolase n=1 Tax=Methanobrevibacter filiformis TaxID=55758 RepID=A0A166EW05_9EURY|nr:HAD hydrolase family protein [Methanobrevibacter filiformis]KZX17073.1 hypothetical protein MBFIL_03550 [Methanobrevibacter filiformis]
MSNRAFITDCEGPISLNDNAFELCAKFIENGEEFFKKVSSFDDYIIDEVKKENYNAGDTLKLIAPFLKAYGLTNEKITEFSRKNISLVNGAKRTMEIANDNTYSFIVSTSYGQYIEALCNEIDFPFENTFFTELNIDGVELLEEEKEILLSLTSKILESDFEKLEKIFFEEIPKLNIYKLTESVKTVGGLGKKIAIDKILNYEDLNLAPNRIMYIGDSITDVEPLQFVKENKGIAISFNGNEYALKNAEIAIISNHTSITSVFADLHSRFSREYILEFVKAYSADPKRTFESFRTKFWIVDIFKDAFKGKELPIIELITEDNFDELLEKSLSMRKNIRGISIGELS